MTEEKKNLDSDVIYAFLKLSRAMRRCPPKLGPLPFPPAVGRLLECAAANPGVSSRELCEALDLRPSSLSEILGRAENEGLLCRTVDGNDRRIQRVFLTPQGSAAVSDMEAARNEDAKKKTSCLTDDEKVLFCSLCNRLSEHIEKLALDLPDSMMPDHSGPHQSPRSGPEGPGPFSRHPDEARPGNSESPDFSPRHPGGDRPGHPEGPGFSPRHPGENHPGCSENPGSSPRHPGEEQPEGPGDPPMPAGGRYRC